MMFTLVRSFLTIVLSCLLLLRSLLKNQACAEKMDQNCPAQICEVTRSAVAPLFSLRVDRRSGIPASHPLAADPGKLGGSGPSIASIPPSVTCLCRGKAALGCRRATAAGLRAAGVSTGFDRSGCFWRQLHYNLLFRLFRWFARASPG